MAMAGNRIRMVVELLVTLTICTAELDGLAATTELDLALGRVRKTVVALNQWLGSGENGGRWRRYLRSDQLDRQLARGNGAEVKQVLEVLQQYESGVDGLQLAPFAAVRKALQAWVAERLIKEPTTPKDWAVYAKDSFAPVTDGDMVQTRVNLEKSADRLDRYLSGGRVDGVAWKKYLHWSELETQWKTNGQMNLKILGNIYRRFTANHVGLELPQFAAVARAVRRCYDLAALQHQPHAATRYEREVKNLAVYLKEYAEQPTEEGRQAIGVRLGWLEASNQNLWLVQAVRHRYSQSNLYAQASAQLVAVGIMREVLKTGPITDVILGTRLSGTTETSGFVELHLIPNRREAVLENVLVGTTTSDTVGRSGPVTTRNVGLTNFLASKRIVIDAEGIRGVPASSDARSSTRVRGLSTRYRGCVDQIVRKFAWRRIGQTKRQVNVIASRHAEQRINRLFDLEADKLIVRANQKFLDKFRKPLLRRGEFPPELHFSTSENFVFVKALQVDRYQLGAPGPPPNLTDNYDLAVRVHESYLNNLLGIVFSGEKFTEERVQKIATEIYGELPEELQSSQDEDAWSVSFEASQPVTVLFETGKFTVTLRGRRYTSGDRKFGAMNATAVYQLQKRGRGIRLTRRGEIKIFPPGFDSQKDRLSAQQVALRKLLARKLQTLFKPEITSEGLQLPGNWRKAGRLQLKELFSRQAWLVVGWHLPPPDKMAEFSSAPIKSVRAGP